MGEEEDDAESVLVAELRALAGDGVRDDAPFQVRRGHHLVTVIHNHGSSSSLMLRATYDEVARAGAGAYRDASALRAARPMKIGLHREASAGPRHAHRTGDHAFDTAVFLDTPTTDAAILGAVLGPEVRAGVLSLFELGFLRVTIDDAILDHESGFVEAYLWTFASPEPAALRGERALDAFVRILDHLPAITPSGSKHAPAASPRWIRALGGSAVLALLAGGPLWWVKVRPECESCTAIAFVVAPVVGIIASFVARPALLRQYGDRSGSFVPVALGRLQVLASAAVLTFFVVAFALLLVR